jgi:DNA-binding transcriptional LysR family regulator
MDQLTSLRVFAAVAASLSFSQGANRLGLSPAMASKHIQRLEARVGARLFHRNSRNVSLTEAGAEYLKSVDPLLQGLDEVEAQLSNITNEAKGTLRLTLPVWMANPRFARFLTAYTEAHPGVELDADLTGRRINLVEDGFDLALRVSQSLEEDLIARKVGDVSFLLVAAPAFLDRIGRPASAAHLNGAPFLVYAEVADNGRIRFGSGTDALDITTRPVLKSGNETLIYQAALAGMGFAFLPDWLAADDVAAGRLELVLPDVAPPTVPLYAIYANRHFLPAKVRSFLDFLAMQLDRSGR